MRYGELEEDNDAQSRGRKRAQLEEDNDAQSAVAYHHK